LVEADINHVAYPGSGLGYRSGWQLDYAYRCQAHWSHPPGLQIFLDVYHLLLRIKIHDVDRETHAEGVYAPAGDNP
jgi:hypothetical protein